MEKMEVNYEFHSRRKNLLERNRKKNRKKVKKKEGEKAESE